MIGVEGGLVFAHNFLGQEPKSLLGSVRFDLWKASLMAFVLVLDLVRGTVKSSTSTGETPEYEYDLKSCVCKSKWCCLVSR